MFIKKYLLSSVYHLPDDEKGAADPETARKAAVEAERAKVQVTSVKIEDDEEEKEVKADEQEKEDGEEEAKDEDDKVDDEKEDDKEDDSDDKKLELKAEKKQERLEKKLAREAQKRREAEKEIKALKAKLEANPDKVLTEEDVETRAKAIAQQEKLTDDYNRTADSLADGAQKHLKMKPKEFDGLVKEALKELDVDGFPGEVVGALGDLENGPIVLAHLLKNVDEMEDIFKLQGRPVRLGMELAKLATKLATPKPKKISQVPDPVEPLGGKAATSDRLALLSSKKNLTKEEMDEYVQARNADIANKRKNGRVNLR